MKKFLLLIYFEFFRAIFSSQKQHLLASISSEDLPSGELVQILAFFRHGNYAPSYFFYNGEYNDYGMENSGYSSSTYLGNSQSWSFGRNLKTLYGDFFTGIDPAQDSLYILGNYERSYSNALHISCGLVGNYPDWDYENILITPISAIEQFGYCQECDSTNYIKVNEIAKNGYQNETLVDEPELNIVLDNDFFDIDENCDYIANMYFEYIANLLDDHLYDEFGIELDHEELDEFKATFSSPKDISDSLSFDIIALMYDEHLSHMLEEFSIEQESISALLSQNPFEFIFKNLFQHLFTEQEFTAQLFNSLILTSVTKNMITYTETEKKFIVYMVHDNNLYGLYQLLSLEHPTYPYYSQNLRINIYKSTEEDGTEYYYVNGLYGGETFLIDGCDNFDCPLEDFYDIISGLIIESKLFCSDDQEFLKKYLTKNKQFFFKFVFQKGKAMALNLLKQRSAQLQEK